MFSNILKNLSILKKFLFINLIFFTIIGVFTFAYIKNVQPNLIKKKSIQKELFLEEDYRTQSQGKNQRIFYPLNEKTLFKTNQKFRIFTKNLKKKEKSINTKSRVFKIKNYYEIESIKVKVEKDSNNFIKRISINSEKVNVSVNIMNCKYENINNKYFKLFDFQNLKLK